MSVPTAEKPRVRLEFLDGLRGLAALYVVLFHSVYELIHQPLTGWAQAVGEMLGYGHFAVDVFIVLSGFCLMMPIVRAGTGRLPKGFRDYLRRRARRILPPYYIAFGFSLVLAAGSVFLLGVGERSQFGAGPILSHLFLVHNLDFGWTCAINGPLWSVATEWHIYFFFPLLLLPVWRTWGNLATIAVAFAVGLAPFFLLPIGRNFWWAYPWFLGLFALGMAAAATALDPVRKESIAARCFGTWQATFLLFTAFVMVDKLNVVGRHFWILDVMAGVATASLILVFTRASNNGARKSAVLRMIEAPACVKLGAMSYSLYLIHYPLVRASYRLFQKKIHSPELLMFAQLAFASTVVVGLAYLFHLAFERRFMNQPAIATMAALPNTDKRAA